jgi:hypothetical protein
MERGDVVTLDDKSRTALGTSRGLVGLGQLPAFELPAAGGGRVRSWDYHGRRHLVVWLAGHRPARHQLAEAAGRASALQAEGAELLFVVRGPSEQAEQLRAEAGLRGPVLADTDGRLHVRLDARVPTILVAERNATLYWRAPVREGRGELDEALSWLAYLNILEPECGTCVPAWPTE